MNQLLYRCRRYSMLILGVAVGVTITLTDASGAILFESGTLGPTGVTFADLSNAIVPGTNVNHFIFPGVRFELNQPVVTSQIGGHFVEETGSTLFGAIVKLNDQSDFPNSGDLSTTDVLGVTTLTFPNPSSEVFGNLALSLDPGWYALVFGSGLFGTVGSGAAVRNGMDFSVQAYIAHGPNLNWFNLDVLQTSFENHRFVVVGNYVPEPNTLGTVSSLLVLVWLLRFKMNVRQRFRRSILRKELCHGPPLIIQAFPAD